MDSSKAGSVYYDDYSGRFYFDTKVENLERLSRQKARHAEIMNRSSNKQLENEHKLIQSARDIVDNKMMREIWGFRTNLKDMVSYRNVLKKIAVRNSRDPWHPESMGKYGTGASYFELTDKRQTEKHDMDPMTRRRMLSKTLLSQRKPMLVLDRTLDTDALMSQWQKRCRSLSPQPTTKKPKKEKRPGGIRLPPIAATKSTKQTEISETKPDSSVFVTQAGFYE